MDTSVGRETGQTIAQNILNVGSNFNPLLTS